MKHLFTSLWKRSSLFVSVAVLVGFLAGCGSENADPAGVTSTASTEKTATPSRQPLSAGVVAAYLTIQEALAADRPEAVRPTASALATDLRGTGEAEGASAAEAIARSTDIAQLRHHFETLSRVFIGIANTAGMAEGVVYEVHCPMAFDNRGASWLQRDQTVNNPYFGARMLRCGNVQSTFAAN